MELCKEEIEDLIFLVRSCMIDKKLHSGLIESVIDISKTDELRDYILFLLSDNTLCAELIAIMHYGSNRMEWEELIVWAETQIDQYTVDKIIYDRLLLENLQDGFDRLLIKYYQIGESYLQSCWS